MSETDLPRVLEPGERRRELLRKLYAPYMHLVFLPYLGASTLGWGAARGQ